MSAAAGIGDRSKAVVRRHWKKAVVAIAVVLLLFYGAGGWYFAGILRSDGLVPQAPTRDFGVVVRAFDGSTIELAGDDETMLRPGRFGVWWEGGYAQVGDILETREGAVVRTFLPIDGEPPVCETAEVAGCEEVDLESFGYGEVAHTGLAATDVTYRAELGDMRAWLVPPAAGGSGDTWAIHVHGWRVDRREALRGLPAFGAAGVTSLVVEYRNDPGAPPDPSGFYRFGRTEWADVLAAAQFALDAGAQRLVLFGYSTGAAAITNLMLRPDVDLPVAAIVFDSPNLDFGRAVRVEAGRRKLDPTPLPIPRSLTAVAMRIADLRWDVAWDEIDYVERTRQIDVPMLIFQGTADDTVPPSVARDVAAGNPLVMLVETDARHVESWNADPDAYEAAIVEFLAGALR